MSEPDPFDTAELRAATLQSWRRSPTRLREDTATEADLLRGGYRDRVFTELAQNAADAATRAGVRGQLTVRLVDGELRVANTGVPLDREGVQALAALRASSKTGGVGRFGVGFTAVLALTEEPRVLSRTGSVAFSAARTRAELGVVTRAEPGVADVPVLRLAWPVAQVPPEGSSTEVVLPLREGIDGAALLAALATEAPELLLALPGLHSIAVNEQVVQRTTRRLDSGLVELRIGADRWWCSGDADLRWLARVDAAGTAQPLAEEVLRAPTRTDEELSLPALLIADLPLQPDRRRLLPGTSLHAAAAQYPALVAALPAEQRTRLVPLPGFPRSAVDAELREGILAALRDTAWLAAAGGANVAAAGGANVAPRDAQVLDVASSALVTLLADVIPGLLVAELSAPAHSAALVALGVPRVGLSALADAVSGVQRAPSWWRQLYDALDPLVTDRRGAEELAALGVPLVDGRTVLGPRSTVLSEVALSVPGVRVVHPAAAHPLLVRLGAVRAGAGALLGDELLREAVREADPDDPLAAAELATAVLALVDAAGARPGEHLWLGELLLPDTDGELRPADELLLPEAPLHGVLAADAPFATVAASVLAEYGPSLLRAVGVGWGFSLLVDEDATAPEHDLDGEQQWWQASQPEPSQVHAVRDLDLVDPDKWGQALALLCAEPETLAVLRVPDGYTAWWLRRHAELDGVALGHWRSETDPTFAGLLDPAPVRGLPAQVLAHSTVDAPDLAALLLARLADPGRTPSIAVVAATHRALAVAVDTEVVAVEDLDPPAHVRALSGTVVAACIVAVLDQPWLAQVLPADTLVLGALGEHASALADLLDVALASEQAAAPVSSLGTPMDWETVPEAVLTCTRLAVAVPEGAVVLHESLTVHHAGGHHDVDWWVDDAAAVHARRSGLVSALLHQITQDRRPRRLS